MIALTWFLSPIGKMASGAMAVLVVLGGVYLKGRLDGREACRARAVAEMVRQQKASDAALDAARKQAELTDAENAELEQKVTDYEVYLAKLGAAPGCALSGDDAKRLRDILK